jgi:hypothetical protein
MNDDTPVLVPVVLNVFCYGDEGSQVATVVKSFHRDPLLVGNEIYKTDLFLTDSTFAPSMSNQLEGNGFLIDLDLINGIDLPLQTGAYSISEELEIGNVQAVFYEDFYTDSTVINNSSTLVSGTVLVRPYRSGYLIEITAIDAMDNEFHGKFLGNSNLIL